MSTKKGDHGTISMKKTASNLSKRSVEETVKKKTKEKPPDKELLDKKKQKNVLSKNIKIEKDTEILKYAKNTTKYLQPAPVKRSIPVKSETRNNDKKSTGSSTVPKNKVNTAPIKELIKKNNLVKSKPAQNLSDKPSKSEKNNIKKTTIAASKATNSIVNPTLKEFTTNIDTNTDSEETSSDRPKTATLVKGTIENKDKIGPDSLKSTASKSDSSEEQVNYEDDFESYESDFEEYSSSSSTNVNVSSINSISTSSEEIIPFEKSSVNVTSSGGDDDKNLDSGHFDMPGYKHKPMLHNIKEATEIENIKILSPTNSASLTDEGFEDHKSIQFVNFVDAQLKSDRKRSIQLRQKRGQEILSMVRLDYFSFTLIDLMPISYESYLTKFGTGNTLQIATQTGDDCIDDETQTNGVDSLERSTQQPEVFLNNYKIIDSDIGDNETINSQKSVNKNVINKFLLSSCEVVLKIIEETSVVKYNNSKHEPFSEIVSRFKTDSNVFLGTSITHTLFPVEVTEKLITVHVKRQESVIAVWNTFNCEQPEMLLVSYGVVTCCSFGVVSYELIFTGMENGTINIWNGSGHNNYIDSVAKIPLFKTEINSGHQTKIIGLHFMGSAVSNQWNFQQTNELCSIDEVGHIILWTVVIKHSEERKYDEKDKVALVKNANISLEVLCPDLLDLHCTDFCSSLSNPYYLFISTNYGHVIHYVINEGTNKVRRFSPEIQSLAKCLESCPFSSEYFLVGYENGNIALFSRSSEKPLMVLAEKNEADSCAIELIQWSKNKSTVIYSTDAKNNIKIWDLDESDMISIYSIPYKEQINCMKTSSVSDSSKNQTSLLLIGTNPNNLLLYQLDEDRGQENELYKQSIKTFFNYVKRL